MEKKKIVALILAAGKGTRMNDGKVGSDVPKVMYEALGKPLIDYSVNNVKKAGINEIILVVGYKKEVVQGYWKEKVLYAEQKEQKGTGHAVMMAEDLLEGKADAILVCYGDMPLYQPNTIKKLIDLYSEEMPVIAMLSVEFADPNAWAYGRIERDDKNKIKDIVEQKDCSEEQKCIKECNPGFYIFNSEWLWKNLNKLKTDNAQSEYYLTDMIKIAVDNGEKVVAIPVENEWEALGVNTREQLMEAKEKLKEIC